MQRLFLSSVCKFLGKVISPTLLLESGCTSLLAGIAKWMGRAERERAVCFGMGWEDGTVPPPPLSLPFLLLFAVLCHCIRKFSISPRRYVRLFNREIHYDNRPLTHIRRCVPVNVNQRIMNFGQKMLISVRQKITPRTPEDAVECAVLIPEFTWICRPHPPSISKRVVTSGRANDIMTGDARARD